MWGQMQGAGPGRLGGMQGSMSMGGPLGMAPYARGGSRPLREDLPSAAGRPGRRPSDPVVEAERRAQQEKMYSLDYEKVLAGGVPGALSAQLGAAKHWPLPCVQPLPGSLCRSWWSLPVEHVPEVKPIKHVCITFVNHVTGMAANDWMVPLSVLAHAALSAAHFHFGHRLRAGCAQLYLLCR